MKKLERKLEKLQNKGDEDVCVFLKLKRCKAENPYDTQDCIRGDYIFCDNYKKLYQEYVYGKKSENKGET